jgi:glycosyltransferase involved in cell wall biosynthesis
MEAASAPLVAHVFPGFAVGGAQVRFAALANHFGAGFRHIVVALDGDLSCRERLDPNLDIEFPAVEAPKHAMLANAWRFRSLLRRWRPDVLVTGNWGAIEFALANLPPLARHLHVVDGFGPDERETQIGRRILIRRLVLGRGKVIVPSRNLQRIATEVWKLPQRVVKYVPNGIDLARFAAGPKVTAHNPPVIGTVAGLRPEKNLGRLIRAVAMVAREHQTTPPRLVIVGDGPERACLTALAAQHGIAELTTFTGQRDDTPSLYASFDLFALTSDTEQMPLSLIEAMAAGRAVVATRVGSVEELVEDGMTGMLVPPGDAAALAAAIGRLAGDARLREEFGRRGAERARAFDISVTVDRTAALLRGEA